MSVKNIFILSVLFIYSCENPVSNQPAGNCVADRGGFIDDCGICSGGTSGHVANSDKDCRSFLVVVDSQQNIINGFSMTGAIIPSGDNLTLTIFNSTIELDCIENFIFKTLGGNILTSSWLLSQDNQVICDFDQSTEALDDDYEVCIELENKNMNYSTLFDITNFEVYLSDNCNTIEVSGGESAIDGVCFGNVVLDDCGVCGGTCFNPIENLEEEESQSEGCLECGCFEPWGTCSTCLGPDDPYCDCQGNILDECGICNGNGYDDWECNDGEGTCWNIEEGFCDCFGNKIDCKNNCFSCIQLTEQEDCDGECTWVSEPGSGIDPYCRSTQIFEEDGCGECDDDPYNDCIQDCNGELGGEAIIDNCGICNGNNDCECPLPFDQGFFIGYMDSEPINQPIDDAPPEHIDITLVRLENKNLNNLTQECFLGIDNFIFSNDECTSKGTKTLCDGIDYCIWYPNPGYEVGLEDIGAYCGGNLTVEWGNSESCSNSDEDICLYMEEIENSQIYKNLNLTTSQTISKFQFRHDGCVLDFVIPQGSIPDDFSVDFFKQTIKDCIGVCAGYAELDDCNVCNGDGLEGRECCDGNVKDCAGECPSIFINNEWESNPNYNHNDILEFDDCFICGGDNFGNIGSQMDDFGTCCTNSDYGICHDDIMNEDLEEYDNVQDCVSDGYSWVIDKDCAGICGESTIEDCSGECGGSLIVDCAGICGGSAVYDCTFDPDDDTTWESSCGGLVELDECGVCDGNDDCDCPGSFDVCGVCNGTGVDEDDDDICDDVDDCVGEFIEVIDIGNTCCPLSSIYTETIDDTDVTQCCMSGIFDCLDQCDGGAVLDSCGICDGDNDYPCDFDGDGTFCDEFPIGDCDCLGHEADECGVCDGPGPITNYDCFGNCTSGLDCNGDCAGEAYFDECGMCSEGLSGNVANSSQDICGVCNGNATSCNIGLLTLTPKWNFTQMNLYSNSDCSGFPYYSFYDEICLNEKCYDYSFEFVYNPGITSNGTFEQITSIYNQNTEELIENIDDINGTWTIINSQLCINYHSTDESQYDLEDFCYELLDFENGYYNCENNLDYCINNTVTFTNINVNDDLCSKEVYSFEEQTILNNNSTNINIESLPIPLQNTILFYQTSNHNSE